jgi:motility quorum-sensing regulator/GCU-specific mRNA interferase toxin
MEKRRPHYPLASVLAEVRRLGIAAFTFTAINNARLMGLDGPAAVGVVLGLRPDMFYKSMTTLHDHRVWQDVYHAPVPGGKTAYIKISGCVDGRPPVIQFKEK